MRVRELLAANAICLLALTGVACSRFEQPLGAYTPEERMASSGEPGPGPIAPAEGGSGSISTGDGGVAIPVDPDASQSPDPTGGVAGGRPSFGWPPPMLLDAGPPPSDGSECVFELIETKRRRLDMYLMIDNNSTLPASGAWEDVSGGLNLFVDDEQAAGTGVGIRYFGSTCSADDYEDPTIDVRLLPGNARAIRDSTKLRRWTASPMLPALAGGLQFARDRAGSYPEWKQVVVLVSDALTQDFTCPYTTQDLAQTARDGRQGIPSIETHVIGVGVTTSTLLDQLITRASAYNTIAIAGGSGQAVLTDYNDDASAFRDALHTVRRKASPCEFEAPPNPNLATSQFGVVRYPLATELPRMGDGDNCGTQQGWYYATESMPFPVTLCPASCRWLNDSDSNRIAIVVPCASQP
jgi:hypothetical protein